MKTLTRDPLEDAVSRTNRYWAADGIPEIVMGGFWIMWAAIVLIPKLFQKPALVRLAPLMIILAMVVAGLLMKRFINAWKYRVTFPRTGYIELRQPSKRLRFAMPAVAFTIVFVTAIFVRTGDRWRQWTSLGLCLLLAAGLLQASWKMRRLRLAVLSLAVLAVAITAYALKLQEYAAIALTLLAAGLVCVADGGLELYSYLRAHPMLAGNPE